MQLHEVGSLIEANTAEAAGQFIAEGWILVAIVSGDRYEGGIKTHGPIYVLAKPKKPVPTRTPRERASLSELGEQLG
ncbi:hypothetical protein [Pseudomonas syringae]|uniref:hypothetical protein n=1 Tax=Pseudomonas syringae TaxID=317 RepID=UPI00061AA89D|nr:hypothetical protein [Pseudomonas syringae]